MVTAAKMVRGRKVAVICLLLEVVMAAMAANVTYDHRALVIDGKRRILISGAIHYPRSTPEMWPELIQKSKDGGLDVIETYVFWSGHEPEKNKYNFEGRYDLVKFVKLAAEAGLYVHLRIGPYACAEWNYGGFPVWLHFVPGIKFRTDNEPALSLNPPARCFYGRDGGKRTVVRFSQGERFNESIVRISASTVLFLGLSLRVCSPASARIPPPVIAPHSVTENEIVAGEENLGVVDDEVEEGKLEADFEAYKNKVYSLTVPLKVVALRGSVPPSWIKDFMSSQGKRVRLKTRFRGNLEEIFFDLSTATRKEKKGSASTAASDMISIGDSWLSYAIKEKLIEPMKGIEDQDWYKGLSDKWKIYLRRNCAGEKAHDGETWAVPYRWGSMVIAYKKSKFQKYKLAPIEDWADLWRPELAGRISMVNSPREVVGAVLKCMGASYNTTDLDSQVPGGKIAVEKNLASLMKQIRLFDSNNYLKAFNVGDVWVTVGWSSDVIPVAKRASNVTVIVPKSGATLWADLWAIPALSVSGKEAEQMGGRVRGPSPVIHQWVEFCLQPARSLPFTREVIPGASPSALEGPLVTEPEETKKNRPKLDTNLVSGVPLPEILSKCEFLEPLPEATVLEYKLLIDSVKKQSQDLGLFGKLQDIVSIWVQGFRTKLQPQIKKNT